jgi:fatty-acid desaturase
MCIIVLFCGVLYISIYLYFIVYELFGTMWGVVFQYVYRRCILVFCTQFRFSSLGHILGCRSGERTRSSSSVEEHFIHLIEPPTVEGNKETVGVVLRGEWHGTYVPRT